MAQKDVWLSTAVSVGAVISSTEVLIGGLYVGTTVGNTSPDVVLRNGSTGATRLRFHQGNGTLASVSDTWGYSFMPEGVYFSAGCYASVSSKAIANVVFKEPSKNYR
jgi:hypothetical protein